MVLQDLVDLILQITKYPEQAIIMHILKFQLLENIQILNLWVEHRQNLIAHQDQLL